MSEKWTEAEYEKFSAEGVMGWHRMKVHGLIQLDGWFDKKGKFMANVGGAFHPRIGGWSAFILLRKLLGAPWYVAVDGPDREYVRNPITVFSRDSTKPMGSGKTLEVALENYCYGLSLL